jgi:hypothetical protein
MLVWVLIVACWVGLLLLILHDTTKEDIQGSALSVASTSLKNLFSQARACANKAAPAAQRLIAMGSSAGKGANTIPPFLPTGTARNAQLATIEQRPIAPSKNKWWSKDRRASITPAELESTIAEAVRKTAPGCEDFIGVIVHYRSPKMNLDPNWAVRGVKFGKADRKIVDGALNTVVEQMQREFRLVDP